MTTRRTFLAGAGALIAAPAIVRVSSLMAMPRAFFYQSGRTTRVWLDVETIIDRNFLLAAEPYTSAPVFAYRSIPIRIVEPLCAQI